MMNCSLVWLFSASHSLSERNIIDRIIPNMPFSLFIVGKGGVEPPALRQSQD